MWPIRMKVSLVDLCHILDCDFYLSSVCFTLKVKVQEQWQSCIQADKKKSLFTWWLQYRKSQVMFKVSPASLQTFIDTPNCVLEDRVQYNTVRIPNVFCDCHLQIIESIWNIFVCFLYCNHQVYREILITLYNRLMFVPCIVWLRIIDQLTWEAPWRWHMDAEKCRILRIK
jgi:hypothetical protein